MLETGHIEGGAATGFGRRLSLQGVSWRPLVLRYFVAFFVAFPPPVCHVVYDYFYFCFAAAFADSVEGHESRPRLVLYDGVLGAARLIAHQRCVMICSRTLKTREWKTTDWKMLDLFSFSLITSDIAIGHPLIIIQGLAFSSTVKLLEQEIGN